MLPCLHCFCRDCIDLLRVQGRETFHCPECRKDVTIPDNEAENLPDAYPVYHQIELSRFVDKLASGEVSTCDACARGAKPRNADAIGFCKSCGEHVCQECLKKHKSLSDHKVVSYNELAEGGDFSQHKEILTRSRSTTFERFSRCSVHKDEVLTKYCFDCNKMICLACTLTDHREHKFDLISVSAEKRRGELRDQLPSIRILHKRLAGSVQDVRRSRTSIEDQKQSLSVFIDNEFDRLYKTLERHKAKLHSSLTSMANGKLERLTKQQLSLEGASSELGRLEDFAEDSLKATTEKELLLFYSFLQERITDTTRSCGKVSIAPVETPNLAFKSSCSSHISELCHKHMVVYCSQADPSKCTAEGPGLKSTEMLKTTQFTVHVSDKNRKQCTFPQDVTAKVTCLSAESTISGEVHNSGNGFYDVSFCPTLRGQHEIRVLVNDHHIRGSPFSIHVHQPPSQLGKSQGMIEGVKAPRGITINPAGHILVTEWNDGRIVEYDQHGKLLQSFGSTRDVKSRRRLCHPAGIVTDEAGNIFVVDAAGEQCCVVKYTSEGLQVATVGRLGSNTCEFKNPRGLAISPKSGELYVCDRDNHRLQIFTTDLKFIRCLDVGEADKHLPQPSKPNDVTFDIASNMYVADYANNCILCFASNHQYLNSLSNKGSDPGCLSGPESIHADKYGYLFVTESKNHRVSVFRSNRGDLVSHFGRLGSGEDELKFPMGLVIDANGHVYVCELFNNRIHLF